MAKANPPKALAYLAAVPLLVGFVAGQVGGVIGGIVFALLLLPSLLAPYVVFGTGGPLRQGYWSLFPLAGATLGFGLGLATPDLTSL